MIINDHVEFSPEYILLTWPNLLLFNQSASHGNNAVRGGRFQSLQHESQLRILKYSAVSSNFLKNCRRGYQISGECGGPLPSFLNHILKASVIQEQLCENLLQNLHSVSEVGEVFEHIVVDLLNSCSPRRGELSHLPNKQQTFITAQQ
jgi:hypothetical protein